VAVGAQPRAGGTDVLLRSRALGAGESSRARSDPANTATVLGLLLGLRPASDTWTSTVCTSAGQRFSGLDPTEAKSNFSAPCHSLVRISTLQKTDLTLRSTCATGEADS